MLHKIHVELHNTILHDKKTMPTSICLSLVLHSIKINKASTVIFYNELNANIDRFFCIIKKNLNEASENLRDTCIKEN